MARVVWLSVCLSVTCQCLWSYKRDRRTMTILGVFVSPFCPLWQKWRTGPSEWSKETNSRLSHRACQFIVLVRSYIKTKLKVTSSSYSFKQQKDAHVFNRCVTTAAAVSRLHESQGQTVEIKRTMDRYKGRSVEDSERTAFSWPTKAANPTYVNTNLSMLIKSFVSVTSTYLYIYLLT